MAIRRWTLATLLIVWGAMILSCGMQDYSYEMTDGYQVWRSSAHMVKIFNKHGTNGRTMKVPPKVVEVAWDQRFILAKQQHLRPRGPGDGYEVPVEGQYSYWILDVKESRCEGPLDASGFASRRVELGVDAALILRDVRSCKPRGDQ